MATPISKAAKGSGQAKAAEPETAATTTEVATVTEAGAVGAADYGDYAGQGFDNQTAADYAIPIIAILQGLSPQCKGEDATGRPGMLLDTATGEVYSGKTGLLFVPAITDHCYNEWTPREKGGGFMGRHEVGSDIVEAAMAHCGRRQKQGKEGVVGKDGTEFVETFNIFGVLCSEEGEPLGSAIVSCVSTKIKPYRGLMERLRKFTVATPNGKVKPPLFAHLVRITTKEEKRASGDSYNFVFTSAVDGDLMKSLLRKDDPRFLAGATVRELFLSGQAKADMTGGAGKNLAPEEEDTSGWDGNGND